MYALRSTARLLRRSDAKLARREYTAQVPENEPDRLIYCNYHNAVISDIEPKTSFDTFLLPPETLTRNVMNDLLWSEPISDYRLIDEKMVYTFIMDNFTIAPKLYKLIGKHPFRSRP